MGDGKWLNYRLSDIEERLKEQGHKVSIPVISRLLRERDYRLRVNIKKVVGRQEPERDAQFQHILEQRKQHQADRQPILSVDTKKKELIGNFKNPGRVWCQKPEQVNVHDFPQEALGRAVPYGIYDLLNNRGTLYIGQSADTPTFAVDNIARWCETELLLYFPEATHLMLEADGGGSNGYRSRVWKRDLQVKVVEAFNLTVTVCHYPTGASKWNPIEHRLFSEISKSWSGCPLRSFDLMLDYIRDTRTQTGLAVQASLVTQLYETGVKVPDEEIAALNIKVHDVCPRWNYTLYPRSTLLIH